ncbi:hypothetical protein VTJ83DRAFT_4227 [Remersonia thermophila]|uniref:SMODS and SLOG-associating 2TM effector domain-containing protein n=1 Tax=Remersonia thermophila TaxID=72144 RepID=A0ABR4D9A6_9PEZI
MELASPASTISDPAQPQLRHQHRHQHRFLDATEWARVAHGVGAIRTDDEAHHVVRPTCWYWPPKGMPEGLYRDVVFQRSKYQVAFFALGAAHWALMVVQVTVGAVLTALGSLSMRETTAITILAAANTVGAGLLGLMHNSGLPDRYRMDKVQLLAVEDYIRGVLDTGIVEAQQTVEDVLNECYSRFASARSTILSNKPDVYATPIPNKATANAMQRPQPVMHIRMGRKPAVDTFY